MTLSLPIDPQASALLQRSPLALLIGMLLDQQVSVERAFSAPYDLAQRLGHEPTAAELAGYDADALNAVFSQRPALHRYPRAMAARVQELSGIIIDEYDGEAGRIWADADTGKELLARLNRLPGFGARKAQILVALLGKQFGVRPEGWREAAGEFGVEGSLNSVADVGDEESLAKVRAHKQEIKATAKAKAAR